jgi:preprotein translocase subunit SecG
MEQIILGIHVLTAVAIIALILLQQGKGAEAGASFGSGASQTVFGSGGSGNFFTKATAFCATLFFVTSFSLAIVSKNKAAVELGLNIPALIEVQDKLIESEIPVVDEVQTSVESAVPAIEEEVEAAVDAVLSEGTIPSVEDTEQ